MKRWCLALLLISFCNVVFFTGCQRAELTKVRVSEVTHSVFYAPFYIAINQGFFRAEGIDVELTTAQGADKVMTAVLADQADIGFMGPEASMYVYNQGKDDYVQVFAQLTKRDGSFLVGKKPEKDFTWSAVQGKKIIGGRVGGVPEMTLEYVLKNNDLVPGKDVQVETGIQFALMAGAFTGGDADYVTLFEPVATMLEQTHKGYVITSIGQESGEIPYTVFAAKKSFIRNQAKLVQDFTDALYQGQRWVDTHSPQEVARAIQKSFPDTEERILVAVAKRYQDIDAWAKNPVLEKEAFDRLQQVILLAGQLEQKVPYEKLVNVDFAEKAVKTVR